MRDANAREYLYTREDASRERGEKMKASLLSQLKSTSTTLFKS